MKKPIFFAWLLISIMSGCGENPDAWPTMSFNKTTWSTTKDENRYVFARDLINQKRLNGMNKQQVMETLGLPSFTDSGNNYVTYVLKISSGNLYILDVRFKPRDNVMVVDEVFIRAD